MLLVLIVTWQQWVFQLVICWKHWPATILSKKSTTKKKNALCLSTSESWQGRLLVLFWNMSKGRKIDTHILSSCPHSSVLCHILYNANNTYSQFSTQSVWGPPLRWLIRVIKFLSIMLLGTWVRNTCWNKVTRLLIPQPSPTFPQNLIYSLPDFWSVEFISLLKAKCCSKHQTPSEPGALRSVHTYSGMFPLGLL